MKSVKKTTRKRKTGQSNQTNRKVQFQIEGLFKLEKVGDYLNLVDKKIKLIFKKKILSSTPDVFSMPMLPICRTPEPIWF